MKRFNSEEKQRLGMTSAFAPVFKSNMDVIYVPLTRAAEFQRLSTFFYDAGIYHEYAAQNIARAIEGDNAHLGESEVLRMKSLWGKDREESPFAFINRLRSSLPSAGENNL